MLRPFACTRLLCQVLAWDAMLADVSPQTSSDGSSATGAAAGPGSTCSARGRCVAGGDAGVDGGAPCTLDTQCDDGMFCDGPEVCTPGAAATDARGCAQLDPRRGGILLVRRT